MTKKIKTKKVAILASCLAFVLLASATGVVYAANRTSPRVAVTEDGTFEVLEGGIVRVLEDGTLQLGEASDIDMHDSGTVNIIVTDSGTVEMLEDGVVNVLEDGSFYIGALTSDVGEDDNKTVEAFATEANSGITVITEDGMVVVQTLEEALALAAGE